MRLGPVHMGAQRGRHGAQAKEAARHHLGG